MDDIQRKLEQIDKQLTGGLTAFHNHIISTAPLLFAATGLIVGILLQNILVLSIWSWLTVLIFFLTALILFFAIKQPCPRTAAYLALACFVCLGAIRLDSFSRPAPNDIRNFVAGERKLVTIRGVITTEPYINKNPQWKFAKFKFTDPASSFYLNIKQLKTTTGWAKAAGTIRVRIEEPILDLNAGDYIQMYCWLDRFKDPTNPGQFNTAAYLARKNVFIAASVNNRHSIELLKSTDKTGFFNKLQTKLRQTATGALLGNSSPESPSQGLLQALLLGYRKNIDSDTYQAFQKTGLLHFISLSGMHLAIFMGIIWWLCKTAGLMKPTRAIICIIAVAIFLLIVPPRPPTIRAAIICWVFCASFLFRRCFNSLNTLSFAAIILLLIRPTHLFEAGWQLSFASVLGILLFANRIHFFTKSKPSRYLLRLFTTGLAAWLGGCGILLYHFYTITPLTFLWTVIAFPMVVLILTIGYLKIILSFLLPIAAAALGVIVTGLSELLICIVKFIAGLNISQILIGHVPPAPIILYYIFIVFVAFAHFRRPLIKKTICTVMLLTIIIFFGTTKWQKTHRDNLILTCLDVSHGQAILAQLPGTTNILFDAGSLFKSDVGRRIVIPFLNYIGTNKIDTIIISHNDIDHINGVPEIAEHCRQTNIYANDAFFIDTQTDPWGTAKFLKQQLTEKGFKMQPLNSLSLNNPAVIKILWPSKQALQDQTLGDNDKSLVSLIEFAGRKILFTSDIGRFAQRELLQLFPNLKADIVVVPHHGSTKTADPDFLEQLDANILIYSHSRKQYEKQQTSTTKSNTQSFYTPRDGAITIRIDKNGTIRTNTFTN